MHIAYALSAFFYVVSQNTELLNPSVATMSWTTFLITGLIILSVSLACDFIARLLAYAWTRAVVKIALPIASIYLLILLPLICLLLKCMRLLFKKSYLEEEDFFSNKEKIHEMLLEAEFQQHLDPIDQKLIRSFITFQERVAKEIMVPRVAIYALSSDTTIREAAPLFAEESYSRIPIYKESLDHILGVVLYKDLLKCYASPTQNIELTLEKIAKPVLYAPENKKITQLLQEFRNKQIHMAIIVDEYGGTEGIVTIEDILEELVGEIEDEYDINDERTFWELPSGGWVVDARMTILDIAEQLGIRIPEHPDYETIGGYVYHCAGTIPAKGWRLSHDEFDLEVLSSNERTLKKIKIEPRIKRPYLI